MFLRDFPVRLATRLCDAAECRDRYQRDLTAYVIDGCLSLTLGGILLALFSWPCGVLWEALIIGLTAGAFKAVAGGPHMGTPIRCAFWGALIFTGLGFATRNLNGLPRPILLAVLAADAVAVWRNAPVAAPQKPLTAKQTDTLRFLARTIILLLAPALILWPGLPWRTEILFGVTVQSLSISRWPRQAVAALDESLDAMGNRFLTRCKKTERRELK